MHVAHGVECTCVINLPPKFETQWEHQDHLIHATTLLIWKLWSRSQAVQEKERYFAFPYVTWE